MAWKLLNHEPRTMTEHRCCDFIASTPLGRFWKVPFDSRIEAGGSCGAGNGRAALDVPPSCVSFIEVK